MRHVRFGEIFGSNHDSLSLGSDSITLPGPSANSTTTAASVRPHYARKSFPPSLPIGPIMGRNHLLSEIVGSTNSCPSTPTEKKRCIESLDTVTPAVLPTIPSTVRPTIIHKAKDDELPPAAISNIDVSPLESAIAKTATEFSPRAAEALPTQSVIINKVGETQNGIETAKFANCESESDIQFQSIKKSTIASTIAEATAAKSILKVASPSSPLINVVDVSPEGSQAIASQGNLPLVSCAVCRWQNVDGRMSTMECSKCRKIFHSACHPTPLDKQSDFVCAICLDYKSLMNDYDEIYEGEIRAPSIITPYEYQVIIFVPL